MRANVLVVCWLAMALSACRGDPLVSGERFEFTAKDAALDYCDEDDGVEKSFTLTGEVIVYDESGVQQHTGTVAEFGLGTKLTCTNGKPTSIALTPVGDTGQSGRVTYSHDDSGTKVTVTAALDLSLKNATLTSDPPVVHETNRVHKWFGYDDATPWQVRVVLQKRAYLDDTFAPDFAVSTYALNKVAFSDSMDKRHVNLRLRLRTGS